MKCNQVITQTLLACVLFILPLCLKSQPCGKPNVIFIICDDMRYDSFDITGGPDFLHTPSIDRIAKEGARFDNYYCTYSLCIPSRASMMTGLYPHSNGALDNCKRIKPNIPTLAKVLHNAGYHTGMVGKYHINDEWQDGWDYWLVESGKLDYTDADYTYFDTTKVIPGNFEQVIYDTVHRYLSTVDTPFFLTIGHLAPHRKCTPLPQYYLTFFDEQMPVPQNFFPYTEWYPSFLYDDSSKLYLSKNHLRKDYEGYFEGLLGVEDNTTDIFNILEQRGLLDKTMIIFTSDNGAVFGEHLLAGKGAEYEPSIHLPLFIRYPKWYSPNTVFNGNFFTLNIDIMPTILDAACIPTTPLHMQGTSLRKLTAGAVARPQFLYETIKLSVGTCQDIEEAIRPSMRAVISKNYKYATYHCDHVTEEFFDMTNDPLELNNLIRDSSYQTLIEQYRDKLDSLRFQYSDTLSIDTGYKSCYLVKAPRVSIQYTHWGTLPLRIYPNPAEENIDVFAAITGDGPASLIVSNTLGEILHAEIISPGDSNLSQRIDVSAFPSGIYFVQIRQGGLSAVKTFLRE